MILIFIEYKKNSVINPTRYLYQIYQGGIFLFNLFRNFIILIKPKDLIKQLALITGAIEHLCLNVFEINAMVLVNENVSLKLPNKEWIADYDANQVVFWDVNQHYDSNSNYLFN